MEEGRPVIAVSLWRKSEVMRLAALDSIYKVIWRQCSIGSREGFIDGSREQVGPPVPKYRSDVTVSQNGLSAAGGGTVDYHHPD